MLSVLFHVELAGELGETLGWTFAESSLLDCSVVASLNRLEIASC